VPPAREIAMADDIYGFSAKTIDGRESSLEDYRGKVLLIVNTASKCGFTPQYKGLEEIHRRYVDRGVEVLGFPCNQFGAQEPGDAEEIKNFCSLTYDVSFPMFAKIDVNGEGAHPLYKYLTKTKRGLFGTANVKWNFTKFLIGKDGRVVARYGPLAPPEKIEGAIAKLV
jgi:glutathione peroxidase